jgi:hypothetical protein
VREALLAVMLRGATQDPAGDAIVFNLVCYACLLPLVVAGGILFATEKGLTGTKGTTG